MAAATDDDVRAAYIIRMRDAMGRRERAMEDMAKAGFERVDVTPGLMPDGREAVRVGGASWAMRQDVHAKMLKEAFAASKKSKKSRNPAPEKSSPGEGLTSVLCPACSAVMAKEPVCPNCAKGKAGYKILCICTECGHEVYL